jgi:predicted naringenin-chalcone synthase
LWSVTLPFDFVARYEICMSFAILGMGTAVPPHRYSQEELITILQPLCCDTEAEAAGLAKLFRHTRIAHRHLAYAPVVLAREDRRHDDDTATRMRLYEREALPLAQLAAERALAESAIRPGEITHLVTVSCTGFAAPGFDVGLIQRIGLPPTVERTHVGFMGCHGALNALRVARAYTEADPAARVLVCAVELCSLHFRFESDVKRQIGNALFADGAAAVVGKASTSTPSPRVVANGACLLPECADAMSWTVGNHGFTMELSARVPELIGIHLRPWMEAWLRRHELRIDQVGAWAIHPGGPRILAAVERSLGVAEGTAKTSRDVLTNFGNMSSPTVLFILDRLRREAAPRPWVALGFGPGLAAEAALVR